MEKNYLVLVCSVEEKDGILFEKHLSEHRFESYFDALDDFDGIVGSYVFYGSTGTFSCHCFTEDSFNARRVILVNKLGTYYITLYDFKK